MCLTTTACNHNAVSPEQGKGATDAPKKSELNQVSDSVGDIKANKLQLGAVKSREELESLGLEYSKPTGQWFKGNGFNLIFTYSSGTQRPGAPVSIVLNGPTADQSVRFQLTQRGTDYKRVALIAEAEVHQGDTDATRPAFQLKLPNDKENVHYLLSAEILASDGHVDDVFITDLYVPPQTMNARLSAESISASANSTTVNLYNAGPTTLIFGAGFGLQKKTGGAWFEIPDDRPVASVAYKLKPGEQRENQFIFRNSLVPGTYRVILALEADGTEKKATLAAEFEVR